MLRRGIIRSRFCLGLVCPKQKQDSMEQRLCLSCGLCCNGVIFADVQLETADDPARLLRLGLPLSNLQDHNRERRSTPLQIKSAGLAVLKSTVLKFPQPCTALEGCSCRIYPERPTYCRQFECLLLKNAKDGLIHPSEALGFIRQARERAGKVRRLLNSLGDTAEHHPLSIRFRRTSARMQKTALDEQTAERYAELTLAVHDLNCLLNDAFYPGR